MGSMQYLMRQSSARQQYYCIRQHMLAYAQVCWRMLPVLCARAVYFLKKKCDLVLRFECAAAYHVVHRLLCVCVRARVRVCVCRQ